MSKKMKDKLVKFNDYNDFTIRLKKADEGGCIIEIHDYNYDALEFYTFAKTKKEIIDKISKFIGK